MTATNLCSNFEVSGVVPRDNFESELGNVMIISNPENTIFGNQLSKLGFSSKKN